MKAQIEKYYHLGMLIGYLGLCNFKEVGSLDHLIVFMLFVHSAYHFYAQQRGKVLDKDSVVIEVKGFEEKVGKLVEEIESLKKENKDLSQRVSIITSKSTISNQTFKY